VELSWPIEAFVDYGNEKIWRSKALVANQI